MKNGLNMNHDGLGSAVCSLVLALVLAVLPVSAQQSQDNMPGYPPGGGQQSSGSNSGAAVPYDNNNAQAGPMNPDNRPPMPPPQGNPPSNSASSPQAVPPTIILPAGTVIQVRTNQWLSSDRNLAGDGFNAMLVQPIVVDGWVVARGGQSVLGRVTVVDKAKGSNHHTSQLGVQLSELTFADGQLLPIQTQLAQSATTADRGQQVGTVGATTGAGAVIGAVAGGGTGAAIGAGIGAIAGLGIVTTHGKPTIFPPESLLTFRLEAPVSISTVKSQFAFRPVTSADYNGAMASQGPQRMMRDGAYPPPASPYGGYGYPYAYDPYFYPGWGFYGPALGFGYGWGYGPRFYGYGGGFRGRFR
jgi:hypothetical protein